MNIFRNIKAALAYANYDFYRLKKEIVDLVKKGREQGLDNPDYCKLTVKNSSLNRDYPVLIDLYYKIGNNEAMHLPQELLIGTFSTIPSTIKQTLTNNGFVEIKINNLAELCISAAEEVEKPIKFDAITNFSSSKQLITHRIVTIKDEIFSYRVVYKYNTQESDNNIKVVTYSDIMGMPSDVIAKLKSNIPLSSADVKELEEILWSEVGTKEDYEAEFGEKPLGEFVREIVGLDMSAAKEAFAKYLNDVNLDSRQIYFVNQIVEYIVHNGLMKDLSVLQESPFTDKGSVVEIFTDLTVWIGIRKVIEQVNANAIAA